MHRLFAARPLALAAAIFTASVAVATPASAEIVSKLPGADGLPFPARFIDASTDGRYVLLAVGVPGVVPAAPGPEADVSELGAYVLRDRVADTITPLKFRIAAGDATLDAYPVQVSDDGDRILVQGEDPALRTFAGLGASGLPTAVFDRSESKLLRLPTSPTGPTYGATTWLSADGNEVVFRATSENTAVDNAVYKIYRGPVGGTATAIVSLPSVSTVAASADLKTVLYSRYLPMVTRPVEDYPRTQWFQGSVTGAVVGAQPPRIIAEDTRIETPTPAAATCSVAQGITERQINNYNTYVSPDGGRSGWLQYGPGDRPSLVVRAAGGTTSSIPSPNPGFFPLVTSFGNANQTLFDSSSGFLNIHEELVDGDTETIGSAAGYEYSALSPKATRYVEAKPYSGAPVTTPAPPMTFTDEPVDTAGRQSQATWYSCPPGAADAPLGKFEDYIRDLNLAKPFSAKYQLGGAIMRSVPSSALRPAAKLTAEITVLGLPYWKKTVTGSTASANFPRPLAYLPMTLKFTVQFAAAPGTPAPAPIARSYSIYANRVN